MSKTIFLEAGDVWLFRDGRPFRAGEEHRATSVFPPYPSVLYGALRTAGFLAEKVEFREGFHSPVFGSATKPGTFRLLGPVLAEGNGLLFPCPLDVVREKEGKRMHRLVPLRGLDCGAGPGGGMLLHPAGVGDEVEPAGGWIDVSGLAAWMAGKVPEKTTRGVAEKEPRIGLALDDPGGRRPREGHLYIAEFVRPAKGIRLAGWIDGDEGKLGSSGILRLGGDGHTARYEIRADGPRLPDPPAGPFRGVAILLLTPAFFGTEERTGWRPERILDEHGLELVAAAVGRSVPVGGWDLVKLRPKPIRRAVPAGSVYLCHLKDPGSYSTVMKEIHGRCISDLMPEAGFGLAAVGGWNHV